MIRSRVQGFSSTIQFLRHTSSVERFQKRGKAGAIWRACQERRKLRPVRIHLAAVSAQTLELRFVPAHEMSANSAVKRSARATGEIDHLSELLALHAIRTPHQLRVRLTTLRFLPAVPQAIRPAAGYASIVKPG